MQAQTQNDSANNRADMTPRTWPQKLWGATKAFATTLILPTSIKKACIYLAVWHVAHPLMLPLFPKAEDRLKEYDLDPKLAQELAPGVTTYIRDGNTTGGKLHALLDRGPLLSWWMHSIMNSVAGYNSSGRGWPLPDLLDLTNSSAIYLSPFQDASENNVHLSVSDKKNAEKLIDVTLQQKPFLAGNLQKEETLLHELGHSRLENRAMTSSWEKEADADRVAAQTLARERNDPGIIGQMIKERALLYHDVDHDTVLYLDAVFNHRAMPSEAEILDANSAARAIIPSVQAGIMLKKSGICKVEPEACKTLFTQASTRALSPLAQRRVELFRQAFEESLTIENNVSPPRAPAPKALS